MRAILRCDVKGSGLSKLHRQFDDHDPEYEKTVVELFHRAWISPNLSTPNIQENDDIVAAIFDHVPSDIEREERKRIVLTGYTSDGQAHFAVCAIHYNRLHIRTQAATFLRLSKSCNKIYESLPRFLGRIWWRLRGKPYMKLDPIIQALEPKQELPTIMGKAIRGVVHAFLETSKRERVSLVLVVVGAIFSASFSSKKDGTFLKPIKLRFFRLSPFS